MKKLEKRWNNRHPNNSKNILKESDEIFWKGTYQQNPEAGLSLQNEAVS